MPEASSPSDLILVHSARQLLTLRGLARPRRGLEMQDLGIITDGAILIHRGVIEDVGPTRRVANLTRAKRARKIDATGRVVMPAFVDPDAPLVMQALSSGQRARLQKPAAVKESPSMMSRSRMEIRAAAMAQALASYGVLLTGASTDSAGDPKSAIRILDVQKTIRSLPTRIRSVLTWPAGGLAADPDESIAEWLNTIRIRDLASIVEFAVGARNFESVRRAAQLAMQRGFAVRFRSEGTLDRRTVELALGCGAIAVHGSPASAHSLLGELAEANCVFVAPCAELIGPDWGSTNAVRDAIQAGIAVAISSAFRTRALASFNMQFNLHLACSRLKLTPEQAITAATHNAACALRLADSAGSLAPGGPADLIVMDVPDFRELVLRVGHHDVMMVMRAGRVIYRRPALTAD